MSATLLIAVQRRDFPFSNIHCQLKHILFQEKHKKLVSLIRDQLVQIGDQQFHTRDLFKRLPPEYQLRLNDFTLSAFMRSFKLQNYLGRNVFGPFGSNRTTINEIIIDILRTEGRRMHASEILEQVSDIRSVSPTFQIHGKPPIKHLGDNYFELEEESK